MVNEEPLLPIRIVNYSRDFSNRKKPRWPGDKKKFDISNFKQHQKSLVKNIDFIEKKLDKSFKKYPLIPAVLKVDIREDAIAKSHRPHELFNEDTPIIGLGGIRTLYVSTTEYGLQQLKNKLNYPDEEQIANITTIQNIADFDLNDRLKGLTIKQLKKKAKRDDAAYLKVILFNHHNKDINKNLTENFISLINKMNLEIKDITELSGFHVWKIKCNDDEKIQGISNHPAVKEVSFFPEFKIILPKELTQKQKKLDKITPKDGEDYAKVGIIDTGISKSHPS
jgi:hypothetical protein